MGGSFKKPIPPPGAETTTVRDENAHFGRRKQLYCQTGYFLAIMPDGKVVGVEEDMDPNAIVEFSSVQIGQVRIRGVQSNLYLAMNCKGQLYGEENAYEEGTIFIESINKHYLVYLSRLYSHFKWYVALKKTGKPKNAKRTKLGQKAIQFLTVKLANERK